MAFPEAGWVTYLQQMTRIQIFTVEQGKFHF